MSNELVEYNEPNRTLVPDEKMMQAFIFMAKQAANSKFYDKVGGEAGLLSIMLLARELDVPPMQALSGGIWNIQGKVEMSARMMNMKIRHSGHKLNIIKWDLQSCTIKGIRKDTGEEMSVDFSMEDAKRAGLLRNPTWEKYPREMLFNRALSIIARMLFPDVIGNCYVEGEIKDAIEVDDQEKKDKKNFLIGGNEQNKVPVSYASINAQAQEVIHENSSYTDLIYVPPQSSAPPLEPIVNLNSPIVSDQLRQIESLIGEDFALKDKILKAFEVADLFLLAQKDFPIVMKRLKASKK
jgi:hypothetical protein